MTAEELIKNLQRKIDLGRISPEDEIYVRDPYVSDAAMDAGTDGYHEVDEILVPGGRVILLGAS